MDRPWYVFFSQTGSEIVNLVAELGRVPDMIFTNNVDESKYKRHPMIGELSGVAPIVSARHDSLMEYFLKSPYVDKTALVTLHGYLRIVPDAVCNAFEIYNGHPGAIDIYPELKGKDPQEKVWQSNQNYPIIGSVVHKCIPELDAGNIVKSVHYTNRCDTLDELYDKLKQSSLEAWTFFLKEKLKV